MKENNKKESLAKAKKLLKKGDTIYAIVRHVSQSGMSRDISFYVIKKNQPIMIDYLVHELLDYPFSKREGVKVGGCGMDMTYHVISSLARVMFGYISPQDKTEKYTNCYGFNHRTL